MALYVAICDDNVADRKHFERLLGRENDERQKTAGVIYIDSFGSREALMHTPVKYDLFLIDVTNGSCSGMELAKELRGMGISAPIVLYGILAKPAKTEDSDLDIICLPKPITKKQLSHILDIAVQKAKTKTPLIEIRGETETHFISHLNIVYACQEEYQVKVLLKDNTSLYMLGSMNELEKLVLPYRCFIYCKDTLVNMHHITGLHGNAFSLTTKDTIPFGMFRRKELLQALREFKNRS